MDDGDRARVFYNFIPTSQFSWRTTYKHTIDMVRKKYPIDRNNLGTNYVFKLMSELHPVTEEELLKLPRYNSMKMLKSKDSYARIITKLPRPI